MRLRLDPLQVRLIRSVRFALSQAGDPWEQLTELSVPRLGLPLEVEGFDLGLTAELVVLRELGRALEPLPGYRETMLAAGVLAEVNNQPISARVLPAVAGGEYRMAVTGLWQEPSLKVDDQGKLWGRSELLAPANWDAVVARAWGVAGNVFLYVRLPQPACRVEHKETLAGPALCFIFEGVEDNTVLVDKEADTALERVYAAARVRQAAFLLGIGDSAIMAARDHVNQRQQFGKRLIDFQSVAHRLAALTGEAEGIELLVHEAAWRCDVGLAREPFSVQSLAAAAELALQATRLAVQLHGARGLLADGKVARAYRLAAVEAVKLGTPAQLWREAGNRRLEALV